MLKEELILRIPGFFVWSIFELFLFGIFGFKPGAALASATPNSPRDSRAEIGRSIASGPAGINLQQLRKIQLKYNTLGNFKKLKARLGNSLNKEDESFFKTQKDQDVLLPKARILDGELHLVVKEGDVKIVILDLPQGKFQINSRIWQLSRPFQLKDDVRMIGQILRKSSVLGAGNGVNLTEVEQRALAIYAFGFLAVAEADSGV